MNDDVPIRTLKPLPVLISVVAALFFAILVNRFLLPHHGRIVLYAAIMSMFCVYSAADMLAKRPVVFFVLSYICVHVIICFLPGISDQSYYGAVLIPISLVDYVASVYALSYVYKV